MKPPLLDTPLTRFTEHLFSHQLNHRCAGFEMDFYKCANKVGVYRVGRGECKEFYEDFIECTQKLKQKQRYVIIQAKLKEKGDSYLEPPPADTFFPNGFE